MAIERSGFSSGSDLDPDSVDRAPAGPLITGLRSKVHPPLAICPIDSNTEKHTTRQKAVAHWSSLWVTVT